MTDRTPDIDPLERYDEHEFAVDEADWLDSLTPEEKAAEMRRLASKPTDPDET